jgi:hypothetical protein
MILPRSRTRRLSLRQSGQLPRTPFRGPFSEWPTIRSERAYTLRRYSRINGTWWTSHRNAIHVKFDLICR